MTIQNKNVSSSNESTGKKEKSKRKMTRIVVTEHFSENGKTIEELMTDVILNKVKKQAI